MTTDLIGAAAIAELLEVSVNTVYVWKQRHQDDDQHPFPTAVADAGTRYPVYRLGDVVDWARATGRLPEQQREAERVLLQHVADGKVDWRRSSRGYSLTLRDGHRYKVVTADYRNLLKQGLVTYAGTGRGPMVLTDTGRARLGELAATAAAGV